MEIRRCGPGDRDTIHEIVNAAAQAYRGRIPADCWHEPYMPMQQLDRELAAGVEFWAAEEDGRVLGVMGLQAVQDVDLIRHAYVRAQAQGRGVGGALLEFLKARAERPMLVGTWADAIWAIRFYQGHGFRVAGPERTAELLGRYWSIPPRQAEVSVVLEGAGA